MLDKKIIVNRATKFGATVFSVFQTYVARQQDHLMLSHTEWLMDAVDKKVIVKANLCREIVRHLTMCS